MTDLSTKIKAGMAEYNRIVVECEKLSVLMMMFDVNLRAHYKGKKGARRSVPKHPFYVSCRTFSQPRERVGFLQFWTYEELESFVHEIIREKHDQNSREEEAV